MSFPSTFEVFSPNLTWYKTLSGVEYLDYTKKALTHLLNLHVLLEKSLVIAPIVLLLATTVCTILEDKNHVNQSQSVLYQLFNLVASLALTYTIFSCGAYALNKFVAIPSLQGRVSWLQDGLAKI